ncbi:MAG TPA: SUMF1/EgtB/PvdO family nonheme iron enzyme, partial [bacterium]|nr:SUMF1/EgtB/PvdO family nonheme iron enzyme [bacterium]
MKKLLISLIFVLLFFVGSCGGDDTGDTGNTGNPDTGAMVSVPAGSFQMGCNEAVDDQCDSDESPYHEMTLSAYKIDKYEVTAGEYQKCVDAGDCNNSNESEPHYY